MTPLPAIDSLTPEAIRVLCAEKLGWEYREGMRLPWVNPKLTGNNNEGYRKILPNYPVDARAALELCAWMAAPARGWTTRVTISPDGVNCFIFKATATGSIAKDIAHITAPTFALAVAKAFCVAQGIAV